METNKNKEQGFIKETFGTVSKFIMLLIEFAIIVFVMYHVLHFALGIKNENKSAKNINLIGVYNEDLIVKEISIPNPSYTLRDMYIVLFNETDKPIYAMATVNDYFILEGNIKVYDRTDTGEIRYLSPYSTGVIKVNTWTPGYIPDGYDVELEWDYEMYDHSLETRDLFTSVKRGSDKNLFVVIDNESDENTYKGKFETYIILYKRNGEIKDVKQRTIDVDLDPFSTKAVYIPELKESYHHAEAVIQRQ